MGLLYDNKEEIEKIGKIIDFVKKNNIDKDEDRLSRGQMFYYETEKYNYFVAEEEWSNCTPTLLYIEYLNKNDSYNIFVAHKKDNEVILISNRIDINERYAELFA